jgi:lipopolysaccharide/colanic/teichoic acid biosynthesis glycosyltransferase
MNLVLRRPSPASASSKPHDARPDGPEPDAAAVEVLVAGRGRLARASKRLTDVVLAAAGLAIAAPLLVLLALLIRLDSAGPVLYRQIRLGRRQRPFVITKLRTMDDAGRVTRLGRWLRPMGIDELPQLWHVLRGQMSIVGPRPEEPYRAERFARELPDYWVRHVVRPGITGWAQVNGLRGHVSIAERLRFDLQYLASWGLALDGRILLQTVGAVWRDTRRSLRR